MATRNLRIKLKYQGNGAFCATVNVPKQGVDRTDRVKWKVDQPEPPEFPRTAVVAVDFAPDKDPLISGALGHHRGQRGNDHKIEGRVGFVEDGDYPYMVSWVSEDGVITHMVDPELVVEGGPGNVAEARKSKKAAKKTKKAAKKSAAAGRKKPAKKSAKKAGKKAGKKAKKGKKAKRSTKRKAKKR
jgi:hypothetical protein